MRSVMVFAALFVLCCVSGGTQAASLDGDPAYEQLKQLRAEVVALDAGGEKAQANELRAQIIEQFPQWPWACAVNQYEIARYYQEKGALQRAEAEYTALTEKYAKEEPAVEGLWWRAQYTLSQGRIADCKVLLRQILDNHGDFPLRERIRSTMADRGLAVEMRRVLILQMPDSPGPCAGIQREICMYFDEMGLLDQAIREYQKLAENYPTHRYAMEARLLQGCCNLSLRRYADARECAKGVMDTYPTWPGATDAAKVYAEALARDPETRDEGIRYCNSLISDASKSEQLRAHALTMLGLARQWTGDVAGALEAFESCRAQYSALADMARYYKCDLLAAEGRVEEATAIQHELYPRNRAWGLIALARILRAQGDGRKAYETCNVAADVAQQEKDEQALGAALLYAYDYKRSRKVADRTDDAKRALVGRAPRVARELFETDAEFEQYREYAIARDQQ